MKKMIITIILLILIALAFIGYKSGLFTKTASLDDDKNTALMVKAFLDKMIPHHQEAVTSSLQVMNDLDITEPKVRVFAANIVDTQSFEMDQMKNIYGEYLGSQYEVSTSTYHNMMTDISKMKGDELAKTYKREMIKHHEGAIKEAKIYIKLIDKVRKASSTTTEELTITNSHPSIDLTYDLAKNIVASQEQEIVEMETWY